MTSMIATRGSKRQHEPDATKGDMVDVVKPKAAVVDRELRRPLREITNNHAVAGGDNTTKATLTTHVVTKVPSAKKMRMTQQQQMAKVEPIRLEDEDEEMQEANPVPAPVVTHHNNHTTQSHSSSSHTTKHSKMTTTQIVPRPLPHTQSLIPTSIPYAQLASWQRCLDDPCQEYADSIYQHLRTTEMELFPDPIYMDKVQGDLTHAMRSILVDWLVDVALEYKLKSQTLFLTVSYLDRFLSVIPIERSKIQLVGITCMLLAAKYWEIYPPSIEEFVYISDKTYSKDEVLAMENTILTVLKFKLTSPTSWEFSRRFCKAADADQRTEHLVDYLLELMLEESPSLTFRPSIIAASALFLALYTLQNPPWSERLEINTGIRVEELQSCVRIMHTIYVKTCCGHNTLKSVKTKYSSAEYGQVALIKERSIA